MVNLTTADRGTTVVLDAEDEANAVTLAVAAFRKLFTTRGGEDVTRGWLITVDDVQEVVENMSELAEEGQILQPVIDMARATNEAEAGIIWSALDMYIEHLEDDASAEVEVLKAARTLRDRIATAYWTGFIR